MFGVVPSVCSKIINKMLHLLVKKLMKHPLAKITFPSSEKMAYFAQLIQAREPLVDDVIGFMDPVSFTTECTPEQIEQNAMYNGSRSDTMNNNIFVYGPDGKVFLCVINFPGSWHDRSITANILPYITNNIGNYKICIDQGFSRSGDAYQILVGPVSKKSASKLATNVRSYLLRMPNVYTSLRQASEWGMRALQGTFPRCKKRFPSNAHKCKMVMQ